MDSKLGCYGMFVTTRLLKTKNKSVSQLNVQVYEAAAHAFRPYRGENYFENLGPWLCYFVWYWESRRTNNFGPHVYGLFWTVDQDCFSIVFIRTYDEENSAQIIINQNLWQYRIWFFQMIWDASLSEVRADILSLYSDLWQCWANTTFLACSVWQFIFSNFQLVRLVRPSPIKTLFFYWILQWAVAPSFWHRFGFCIRCVRRLRYTLRLSC